MRGIRKQFPSLRSPMIMWTSPPTAAKFTLCWARTVQGKSTLMSILTGVLQPDAAERSCINGKRGSL